MSDGYPKVDTEFLAYDGRCLCGDISYHVEGESFGIIHCHCQRCRKATGAVVIGFTIFDWEKTEHTWLSGRDKRVRFRTEHTTRSFCPQCGSTIGNHSGNSLNLGEVKLHWYLYTGSKCPWTVIPDEVEQWETAIDPPDVPELNRPTEPGWITGSCLCGKVAYSARNPVRMMNCHCTRCRLSRAAAHATNLFVDPDHFRWRSGEDNITRFDLPGADSFATAFCKDCGSLVPKRSRRGISIPAGGLDSDPGILPTGHIFTAYKASWHTIHDDLPQWRERPDG